MSEQSAHSDSHSNRARGIYHTVITVTSSTAPELSLSAAVSHAAWENTAFTFVMTSCRLYFSTQEPTFGLLSLTDEPGHRRVTYLLWGNATNHCSTVWPSAESLNVVIRPIHISSSADVVLGHRWGSGVGGATPWTIKSILASLLVYIKWWSCFYCSTTAVLTDCSAYLLIVSLLSLPSFPFFSPLCRLPCFTDTHSESGSATVAKVLFRVWFVFFLFFVHVISTQ